MIMIPFSAEIGGSTAYWLCFALLFFFGLFSGVNNALCYSYNAKLPSSYIAIFLTSHGAAGIFSNLLRLISLNIWPISPGNSTSAPGLDDTDSAFKQCLFIQTVGVFIVLLCLPAQCILNRNEFANYHFFQERSQEDNLQRSAIDSASVYTNDDFQRQESLSFNELSFFSDGPPPQLR